MKKAFTLIELLVVISIIALLMAILMPALSKAKMQAGEIVCQSNLHQYSLATELYTVNFSDRYPIPWASIYKYTSDYMLPNESQRYCRWHNPEMNLEEHPEYAGPYWPYLSSTKANICPIFKRYAKQYGSLHSDSCIGEPYDQINYSYSMNGSLRFIRSDGTEQSMRKSSIRRPSETFLWGEENMWKLKGYSNYVLNDNALCISSSSIDCLASFHRTSPSQVAKQTQFISGNAGEYDGSGVSNLLMADGSISQGGPDDGMELRGDFR